MTKKDEKKDSAITFVGQIMDAYRAAMKVEGEALKAAIECGGYLNLAKENVKADKGKWLPWLKKHCPEISQQTASLYMRLAENKDVITEAGIKTIREGDQFLRKPRDDDDGAEDETDDDDDETNNALLDRPTSPDLKALMENCGADEIGIALRDADKFDEVATASVAKLSPDKVYDALTKVWTADQVRDLNKRLTAYLSSLSGAPAIPKPPTTLERRA